MLRSLLILLVILLTGLALACSDASGDGGTASTPTATVAAPSNAGPPATTFTTSSGQTSAAGIGSSCWTDQNTPGICIDKIGIITPAQPLRVAPGTEITLANPVPGATIREAAVTAFPAVTSSSIGSGELAWRPSDGDSLPSTISSRGVTFAAPQEAGHHVIAVFLVMPQGDVSYGVILEVS